MPWLPSRSPSPDVEEDFEAFDASSQDEGSVDLITEDGRHAKERLQTPRAEDEVPPAWEASPESATGSPSSVAVSLAYPELEKPHFERLDCKILPPDSVPRTNIEVRLPKSTLVNPKSQFQGWTAPDSLAVTEEKDALVGLMKAHEAHEPVTEEDLLDKDFFCEFELDQFSVYVDSKLYPNELRPLQHLCTRSASDTFYFDGILSYGETKYFVRRVPFRNLPLGNYQNTSEPTVGDEIWIQSRRNEKAHPAVYYKLRKPALEYERFHTGFLWITDLAKHVVDFCKHRAERNQNVSLRDFELKFITWLESLHRSSSAFKKWRRQHPSNDFRTSVTVNIEFINKEMCGNFGFKFADSLEVFHEIMKFDKFKPLVPVCEREKDGSTPPPTVVTPYIYKCFSHTEFGSLLKPIEPRGSHTKPAAEINSARPKTSLPPTGSARSQMIKNIKIGNTVSTAPDGAEHSRFTKEVAKGSLQDDHRWYGLVQKVHVDETGERSFDVLWLYHPVDTPCCKMVYPWSNELFLSDNCTCRGTKDERLDEDDILDVHTIDWFGTPETTTSEFFVRQTYEADHRRWITLSENHMVCEHNDDPKKVPYKAGDTVLVVRNSKSGRAEPCLIVKIFEQSKQKFVRLRWLLRRADVDPAVKAQPNELVFSDQIEVVKWKSSTILAKCVVRFFHYSQAIPAPYDRKGAANVFFLTHRQVGETRKCVPLDRAPDSMRQGFDPCEKSKAPKLRGLDLFCGSGNFGRGLEEGGVVDMRWANDVWDKALQTYMANASPNTKGILGSVDDLLHRVINGDYKVGGGLPKQGEVDFISGGSPCQGFSLITSDKTGDKQRKNRSLVASFASFVDFYRPKYGILENVLNIVQNAKGREDDAFSQLICTLVGMSYQVQIVLGDAWAYGAPQSRSRVFLVFAAEGCRLPEPPRPSHSHPEGTKGRGLGMMTSGEPYVSRCMDPMPFKFVSAGEATADLPAIQDAKADSCIAFPDHRLSQGVTPKSRWQHNRIPTHPAGMNFVSTWNNGRGVMTPAARELFPEKGLRVLSDLSKGWGRLKPTQLFPTVTTCLAPTDARIGNMSHWHEDRPITIMEVRRAQGFLDHEVLAGRPTDQYRLVGNSVARQMALAMGLQFREALLGSLYDDSIVPVQEVSRNSSRSGTADVVLKDSVHESRSTTSVKMAARLPYPTPPTTASDTDSKPAVTSVKRPLAQAEFVEDVVTKRQRIEEEVVDLIQ